MAKKNVDTELHQRIESFIADISELVRAKAVEAVGDALGTTITTAPKKRGPGRPRKTAVNTMTTVRRSGTRAKAGKRIRRSPKALEKLQANLLTYVKKNSGSRMEEISAGMKRTTKELRKPMAMLIESKKVKSKGQKRAAAYFASGK